VTRISYEIEGFELARNPTIKPEVQKAP